MDNESHGASIRCPHCGFDAESAADVCGGCGIPMTYPLSMSIRLRLRLTLMVSAVCLGMLAAILWGVVSLQWAATPLVVALLSVVVGIGTPSRRSFALLRADFPNMLRLVQGSASAVNPAQSASPLPDSAPASSVHSDAPGDEPAVSAAPTMPTAQPAAPSRSVAYPAWIAYLSRIESRLGAAALLIGLAAMAFSLYLFSGAIPESEAWPLYVVSVLLTLAALPAFEGGWSGFVRRIHNGIQISLDGRAMLPWIALCAIVLFGLALRIYNLDELPAGLWFDEFDNLDKANLIRDDPWHTPLFIVSTNLPSAFIIPIAIVVELAGVHLTSGRLVAAMFGVAGIVVAFLMVRFMLGMLMGLVAAFLTAAMRWDLNWSRIGMHGITAPLFAALTAYLTYRALRSGRIADFGLAGASLGLGMWFYSAFRIFPLVIAFPILYALLSMRHGRRTLIRNTAVMGICAIIVAAPVVQFALMQPQEFFRRTTTTSVFRDVPLGEAVDKIQNNLRRHLLMFHISGDPNGRHNLPYAPMLDFVSGLLMLIGIGAAFTRWRNAMFVVLPFWVFVMMIPGILTLSSEAPQSLRSITVIPAVIALITLAIHVLWRAGHSLRIWAVSKAMPLALAALLGVIAYANIDTYFGAQASNPDVYSAFSTDETLLTRDVNDNAYRGHSLWFSKQYMAAYTLSLLGDSPYRRFIAAPVNIPIDAHTSQRGATIYLEPRELNYFRTLRQYYPDAQFHEIRAPSGGEPLLYIVRIDGEVLVARQGLLERRRAADGSFVEARKTDDLNIWFSDGDAPIVVELEGSIHITEPGEYTFELQGSADADVTLNGALLLNNSRRSVKIEPAVGLHSIALRTRGDAEDYLRLMWRKPGDDRLHSIPVGNLFNGDVRPVGLTGRFFDDVLSAESVDAAVPNATRITPDIGSAFWLDPLLEPPYFAVWDGTLQAPETGEYVFSIGEVSGSVEMFIDGELVVSEEGIRGNILPLSQGSHRIRVEYRAEGKPSKFELLWTPPEQPTIPIPPEYLSPANQHMFRFVNGE